MSTQLEKFLNKPANMHARETILMHRFSYDIKLAAAQHGYYLNTYFDDVDHDGFDIIFDDQDYIKKIQVKSVGANNTTQTWKIHKKILRPSLYLADKLGVETSPEGVGIEGGIVLLEYKDVNGSLDIVYYYTDIFILLAFKYDIIQCIDGRSKKAIRNCLTKLQRGLGSETVSVPIAAFIQAQSVDSLLSLMGLHSKIQSGWKHNVIQIVNYLNGDQSIELPISIDKLSKYTANNILELGNNKGIALFSIT
jgi:hypothetical protein